MNEETTLLNIHHKKAILFCFIGIFLFSAGFGVGNAPNYCEDACLIVNDTKLNGSSKEWIRQAITSGGTLNTGERMQESDAYPGTVDLAAHHIAMLLGDGMDRVPQRRLRQCHELCHPIRVTRTVRLF